MLTFQAISLFHWWSDGQCPSWFLEFCFHSCRYLGLTQFYTVVSDSVWFYLIFILTRSYIPVIFQVHMVSSYAWFLHNFIESGHHFVPPWKSDLRDRVFISIWFDYVFFFGNALPLRSLRQLHEAAELAPVSVGPGSGQQGQQRTAERGPDRVDAHGRPAHLPQTLPPARPRPARLPVGPPGRQLFHPRHLQSVVVSFVLFCFCCRSLFV